MRGKSKYTVEELNQRLKKLTGNPDDVDLGKMTVYEVEALISRNRSRMVEIAKKVANMRILL